MKSLFILLVLAFASNLSATHLPIEINLAGRIIDADYDIPLEILDLVRSGVLLDSS